VTQSAIPVRNTQQKLEDHLRQIVQLLEKQRLIESLVDRDRSPRHDLIESLVHRQHLVELQLKLRSLHPADIAYILEALPFDSRLSVWRQIQADCGGEVLLEVSDAVRDSLIETLERSALVEMLGQLDADDLM
jgi:magnesium transporter